MDAELELASRVSEKIALVGLKDGRGGAAMFSDTLPLNEAAFAALGVISFTRAKYGWAGGKSNLQNLECWEIGPENQRPEFMVVWPTRVGAL